MLRYLKKGEFDRAIGDFNEAIRLDAKLGAAYYHRCSTTTTCFL
jgi:hypothetical protein